MDTKDTLVIFQIRICMTIAPTYFHTVKKDGAHVSFGRSLCTCTSVWTENLVDIGLAEPAIVPAVVMPVPSLIQPTRVVHLVHALVNVAVIDAPQLVDLVEAEVNSNAAAKYAQHSCSGEGCGGIKQITVVERANPLVKDIEGVVAAVLIDNVLPALGATLHDHVYVGGIQRGSGVSVSFLLLPAGSNGLR